ncbi:hypothetical protein H6G94_12085 [Nostoc punctiforme FACHB-252]|uniref:Secreted protein n=1 Tax=Nostoc punctiforme FACHB-252 TaxID=1357509 RepID=A0ABR8H9B3_NOSPU|nr:hypothetical protein [Nostoc punctiforme]MBD2612008.1 hypothetical protein [Nostoc punctiforme FACHB-252]
MRLRQIFFLSFFLSFFLCALCALCGSLRQAAPRLPSSYSLAHLHTELVLVIFWAIAKNKNPREKSLWGSSDRLLAQLYPFI